jgi:hypothetical protein
MKPFPFLFTEADADGGAGGGAGGTAPAAAAPAAGPAEVPWSEYAAKHPEPSKLEPYKNAKTWSEVFDLKAQRLAEAQTALRSRPPGLPPRPAADAPSEAHTAWRAAHGIPETAEGYGLTKPDGLPDELWDAEEAKSFQQFAHEKGLTPDTVKTLQGWYAQVTQDKVAALQQQHAQQDEQLRQSEAAELGKRFGDRLDATLKDVQTVAQAMGKDPGIFDPASDKFWGVEALQFATDLLKRIPRGEDGRVRQLGAPSTNSAYDKAWAKAALNPSHPDYKALNDPKDPRHAELTRLRNEAYALG